MEEKNIERDSSLFELNLLYACKWLYSTLSLWQINLYRHHIMTSPWYFSTGALYFIVLKSNDA